MRMALVWILFLIKKTECNHSNINEDLNVMLNLWRVSLLETHADNGFFTRCKICFDAIQYLS